MLTECRGEDSECRAPNGKVRDRHKRSIMAKDFAVYNSLTWCTVPYFMKVPNPDSSYK